LLSLHQRQQDETEEKQEAPDLPALRLRHRGIWAGLLFTSSHNCPFHLWKSIGALPLCNSQLTYFRMAYASARLDISAIHGIGRSMHAAASCAILSVDAIDAIG